MFTCAMATFRDSVRAKFTAMSLLAHHPLCGEVLFADNDPDGPQSQDLIDLANQSGGRMRYVPLAWPKGTSAPRNMAVREAAFDQVVVLDSHVLLLPGAIESLESAMADPVRHADLFHGPIVTETLNIHSTHMNDGWGAGMWGKWGRAWRSPDGTEFSTIDENGKIRFAYLNSQAVPYRGPEVAQVLTWNGHEAALQRLGCTELSDGPPFQIPGYGMGLFATRKSTWLGFHPDARGFGGEEMTIHEKYRQAGRRTWCVPGMTWWHDFGRKTTPYPAPLWHFARNYFLNFTALNLDLEPLRKHYLEEIGFPLPDWEQIVAGKQWPDPDPRIQSGYSPVDPTVPPLAVTAVAATPDECGTCGDQLQKMKTETLADVYERECKTPSDINEHLPTLVALVTGLDAPVVIEMGTRYAQSTTALLHAHPKVLYTYDLKPSAQAEELKRFAGNTDYQVFQGNSETVEIGACDVLFLDTDPHTADRVYKELTQHAEKVRAYIVFHDTEIFGEWYGGELGVLPAVRRFLKENPEWVVKAHYRNNNGLTVISKRPEDRKELPSKLSMAWNFVKATAKHQLQGGSYLPLEMAEERLKECWTCDQRVGSQCSKCGCYLDKIPDDAPVKAGEPGKAFYPAEACPLGKWFPLPVVPK